ncbi:MAG: MmgE/PrpD family protein [Proteobacteria bacterium]|nr:MmgE/PrpD family protein [Pseudomonadota bacterium]MDA1058280.1 MmgE/PrpD family protein [Pseudomonadota bacterium]
MSDQSLTEQLIALLHRPITQDDRTRAALHVLDWIGCAVIGATTVPGEVMKDYGRYEPGGSSKAIGVGDVRAETAAFVNGAFGNVLEMDDIHRTSVLHPGPVVIPAALAIAQATGAETTAFLDALIRGYEVVIRIGASVGLGHYKYFHNTATCGPFGAAAAAGSVLGLNDAQMADALGNAGSLAGGLWQLRNEDVMSKQLHNAHAARSGLVAATLAQRGLTGPKRILEGPQGFYAAMCPDATPEVLTADPDAPWMIYDTSFKPWPACRHAHPTIDATLLLRDRVGSPDDIERIVVRTYADAVAFCDRPDPQNVIDAKFSLQHVVAVVLRDGKPVLGSFDPKNFRRADMTAIREKISVEAGETFSAAFPQHYGAEVEIWGRNGLHEKATVADALGDPGNPVGDDTVITKARELMAAAGLPDAKVAAIVQKTLALGRGGTIDDVTELLP